MEGLFNDKELYTVCKIGNEGESWEKAANSQTTENFVMINGNNDPAVARINGLNNGFASPSFFAPVVTDYDHLYVDKIRSVESMAEDMDE